MTRLNDGFDSLLDWTAAIVGVFLIVQALVMIANVLARQFGSDIAIANSTAQALIAWITFLVAAQQARDGEHFDIDFFHGRFPHAMQQLNEVLLRSIGVLFSLTFLLSAIQITSQTAGDASASGFPKLLLYLPAVLAGLILSIEYVRQLFGTVVDLRG